MKHGMNLPQH